MHKITFYLAFFTLIFAGIGTNAQTHATEAAEKIRVVNSPQSTVINYLNWYLANRARLNKIEIIEGGNQKKTYSVNFDGVEEYLSELKKSGYVSDVYLKDVRGLFEKVAWELEKHPLNDGPINGLEWDYILNIGEEGNFQNELNSAKFDYVKTYQNGGFIDLSTVLLNVGKSNLKLFFSLTKYKDHWLIDYYRPI